MTDSSFEVSRREFLGSGGLGIGSMALASLLRREGRASELPSLDPTRPLAPRPPHFPAKIDNVIFLFMAGGPSQFDLFDEKPKLRELDGQVVPPSFTKNQRFAFIGSDAKLLGSDRKFERRGDCGMPISELLPHIGSIADRISLLKTLKTDVFNHGPAKCLMNTGSPRFGRPAMGAWITYGIGSESQDLPGFVVLSSGPRGPRGGTQLWASGFLPTTYQGVPFRGEGEPILDLTSPRGVDRERQRRTLDAVADLNAHRRAANGDPEILTRIAAYEMAFRMQASAPELIDLASESKKTFELYGTAPDEPGFARNCILARRLVERGVRFVQLYHTDWDHHGDAANNLGKALESRCREVDQASAALVKDLESRGLLDRTLVVWGGEFGRTPMGERRETVGRDHHIEAFPMWLAGGPIRGGTVIGGTDELGFFPVDRPMHVHDLHATILHLLGLDHLRLTFRFQGRDFRLTDVAGEVLEELFA